MRHIEIRELWLQTEVREGRLDILHVSGESNAADLFTKHLPAKRLAQLTIALGLSSEEGGEAT
eukprot:1466335-Heterocapsa_arctica.AAC.1